MGELFALYNDVPSNRGFEIGPDGSTLLFTSNRGGGRYQLYLNTVGKPQEQATAIADNKNGVGGARFTPDGLFILFLRDEDKNENTQIYRSTLDGKEVVSLTKDQESWHSLPRVAPDWKTLVYLRGNHKTGRVELVSQSLDGGQPKVVMEAKGYHVLADLSPDGNTALIYTMKSLSHSQLLAVDLKEGKETQLAPSKGVKAHANIAAFSADGQHVFVITDEGKNRAGLRRINAATGEVEASFWDRRAEVTGLAVSRQSPAVAIKIDYGTHSSLRVLDPAKLRDKFWIKLPAGSVELGEFSGDGNTLVYSFSSPTQPQDIFGISMASGTKRLLLRASRPGLSKLTHHSATVVQIPTLHKQKCPTNLILPRPLPRRKRLPVIVYVHGGPADSSAQRWNPLASFWTSQGFAYLEPNVRGSTGFGKQYETADNGSKRMDAVQDLAEVNKWLRKQRWADPERLTIFGGSYGGYLAYMALGHQPTLWRTGGAMSGIVNLQTFFKTTKGIYRDILTEEFGESANEGELLKAISPITVVGQISAPLFIYQGLNDPRVPRSEQDQIVEALRTKGTPLEYMIAADEGHTLSKRENRLSFVGRSTRFLEQHLDLPGVPAGCAPSKEAVADEHPPSNPARSEKQAKGSVPSAPSASKKAPTKK